MAVKVLKMITGEQVIGDVVEMQNEKGTNIGFKLSFPYSLVMRQVSQPNEALKFDINYIAWMSASSEQEFAIPYSSVIAIGDAASEVMDEYLKQFGDLLVS
jgi:sporulation protein YlmC with PRC-barrel domain